MKKNRISVLSIIFYLFAVSLVGYSVWGCIDLTGALASYFEQGATIDDIGGTFALIRSYFTEVVMYIFYALLCIGAGWLLSQAKTIKSWLKYNGAAAPVLPYAQPSDVYVPPASPYAQPAPAYAPPAPPAPDYTPQPDPAYVPQPDPAYIPNDIIPEAEPTAAESNDWANDFLDSTDA